MRDHLFSRHSRRVKRWVLVLTERGSDREGKRRRIAALLVVLGGLIGSWGVGTVLDE